MMIRFRARWFLAPLAGLLVIAPTIAGWAHDRAHHATANHHPASGQPGPDDEDPTPSVHDHGIPAGSDRTMGGDHADASHHAARIGAGVSSRLTLAPASAPSLGEVEAVGGRSPVALGPLNRQPDQTHHPPSLPRGPPLA